MKLKSVQNLSLLIINNQKFKKLKIYLNRKISLIKKKHWSSFLAVTFYITTPEIKQFKIQGPRIKKIWLESKKPRVEGC